MVSNLLFCRNMGAAGWRACAPAVGCPRICAVGQELGARSPLDRGSTIVRLTLLYLALGFAQRVPQAITTHALGYSHRPNFGAFGYGLEAAEILRRWGSWAEFVRDIIGIEVARQRW